MYENQPRRRENPTGPNNAATPLDVYHGVHHGTADETSKRPMCRPSTLRGTFGGGRGRPPPRLFFGIVGGGDLRLPPAEDVERSPKPPPSVPRYRPTFISCSVSYISSKPQRSSGSWAQHRFMRATNCRGASYLSRGSIAGRSPLSTAERIWCEKANSVHGIFNASVS